MTGPVQVAAALLVERTGMQLSDGLRERLAACLDTAAGARGQTPERHAAGLASDPAAFQELLDQVTVQESGFFRHPDQFAALARVVLPAIEGPVVVWSAGCANGQEPYSLAMELAASGHSDWQVLATDISAAAVARTRAGRYSTAELAGLPPAHRHWIRPAGEAWEIDPALRRRVRVEHANLTARFPIEPGRCQVVFCRNVLIYLARTVSESFLDRLAGWLPPDGLVFLGYSEAMVAPTGRLRVEQVGNTFALRVVPQRSPGGPRPTPPTPASGGLRPTPLAPASGGLWTTRSAPPAGQLRSPTGGLAAGAAGSGAPGEAATAAEMAVVGEVAAGGGDHAGAVAAFRKAVFLDPDQPVAWFQLGLALGAVQDQRGARRAFAAALAALERCDQGAVRDGLDGWAAGELAGVLRAKLGRP